MKTKKRKKINKLTKEKYPIFPNVNINDDNDDNSKGEYDIVLCVDSIKNLTNTGWKIKYNKAGGKQSYEKKKEKETIVVGVVGNGNKGKSFLLKKLSDYKVPMGYNVKTEGLSIIYGKDEKQNLAILDSAGQETPLLVQNENNNKDNNNSNIKDNTKEIIQEDIKDNNNKDNIQDNDNNNKKVNNFKINNKDELEFEEYSRDKLITEFYIQQFILWKSDIIILLVGSITLSEQKLYARVKSEILNMKENQKGDKKLFVVHNLQNLIHKKDVDDYIENVLKKLYNVELKEIQMYSEGKGKGIEEFDKYFLEKENKNIVHLLFINDYCESSSYYNKVTIDYLKQAIGQETGRQKFEILEDSKKFLLLISEQIMENKLSENDIEIIADQKIEKLIIKNHKEIKLKKFIVDEMGITKNAGNTTKYSHYIDTEKSKFVVNFELPGGGTFDEPMISTIQGYYSFRFEGEQNGELAPKYEDSEKEKKEDKEYKELSEEKLSKIILSKNLRKKHPILIDFKVSTQVMQIKYGSDNLPEYTVESTTNGIIIFIFNIILINKSNENKNKKKIKI